MEPMRAKFAGDNVAVPKPRALVVVDPVPQPYPIGPYPGDPADEFVDQEPATVPGDIINPGLARRERIFAPIRARMMAHRVPCDRYRQYAQEHSVFETVPERPGAAALQTPLVHVVDDSDTGEDDIVDVTTAPPKPPAKRSYVPSGLYRGHWKYHKNNPNRPR